MEARLFDPLNPPEWLDPLWWVDQPHVNHVDNRVHQARLESAANTAMELADSLHDAAICDIGSCDGGLLGLISDGYTAFGYDVIANSIVYGQHIRGVDLRYGDVTGDSTLELAPVVVCTEMLEHLKDPHGFLKELRQRDIVEYAIFSSPHSETAEYHEWNHAWAWDREGYAKMITDAGWTIVSHIDVEWSQQIVAKKNG